MFGRKRRAANEAAAKARAKADLRAAIADLIGVAEGGTAERAGWPLVLRPGERLVYPITDGGLFEPRREPGHWSGRSAGFSVPVADGIRFRIGKSAGTYVQGLEEPTVIDTGDVSFTSQRVVFQGGKYTREWLFSKLIGITHDESQPCTAIQVSNREKTSGVVYTGLSPDLVRLELAVAVAIFNGEGTEAASELRDQLRALDAGVAMGAPGAVLPPNTTANPPGPHLSETDPPHAPDATDGPPPPPPT
jgi:hypothetical protein